MRNLKFKAAGGEAAVNTMLSSAPPSGEAVVSSQDTYDRPLSQMTAAELKILAKKLGIGGCDSMTKKQLISAISAPETGAAEEQAS